MFTVDFRFEENQTTIEFPCNEEYLSSKFDELGVKDKLKTSQYVIGTNYAALKWLVTDFADVDELNFLAKCLDSFDKNELNIFEAVCETREPRSVAEMINITYNIYNYTLVQDMSSMESIGRTHFMAFISIAMTSFVKRITLRLEILNREQRQQQNVILPYSRQMEKRSKTMRFYSVFCMRTNTGCSEFIQKKGFAHAILPANCKRKEH